MFTGFVYVIRDCMGSVLKARISLQSILNDGRSLLLMGNSEEGLTIDYGIPADLSEDERGLYDLIMLSKIQVDPTLAKDEPLPCPLTKNLIDHMDDYAYMK